jgi:hypothetical protein
MCYEINLVNQFALKNKRVEERKENKKIEQSRVE